MTWRSVRITTNGDVMATDAAGHTIRIPRSPASTSLLRRHVRRVEATAGRHAPWPSVMPSLSLRTTATGNSAVRAEVCDA